MLCTSRRADATLQAQQAGVVPLLDELHAVHPFGLTGTVTATPDGAYIYAAQGGALAILDSSQATPVAGSQTQSDLGSSLFAGGVGSRGVLPVKLLLDPDADPAKPQAANNLIYIAGGRDGLWAMEADATSGPHAAFRIDDSGNQNPATQNARRWCTDVSVFEVSNGTNTERFLAVLGGRKDASRLRIHRLSDVRAVAAQGAEMGNELAPHLTVTLDARPGTIVPREDRSFAYAMAVDELDGGAGTQVYVALGMHGLARVKLDLVGSDLSAGAIEWGPVFGDNSHYHQSLGAVYGNRVYHEGAVPTAPIVHSGRPLCLDLAIDHRGPADHRLFVALDHLGWCTFDLEGPWSDSMPIEHHEGETVLDGAGEPYRKLYAETVYVRRVDLGTTSGHTSGGATHPALVVGCSKLPFLKEPEYLNEGRTLTYEGQVGPFANADMASISLPDQSRVLCYDVNDIGTWSSAGANQHYRAQATVGWQCCALASPASGELAFVTNGVSRRPEFFKSQTGPEEHILQFVHFPLWATDSAPTPLVDVLIDSQDRFQRRGRMTFNLAPSLVNPELMVTSSNDAGVTQDGALVYDATQRRFLTPYQSPPGQDVASDGYFSSGVIMNPQGAAVLNDGTADYEYRFGFKGRTQWRALKIDGGTSITNPGSGQPPVQVYEQYIVAPIDKFNTDLAGGTTYRGRHYQGSAATFEAYNAYLAGLPDQGNQIPDRILWMSNNGTPQGIWALDLDAVRGKLDQGTAGDVHKLELFLLQDLYLGALTTHPEFWKAPDVRTDTNTPYEALEFIHAPGTAGAQPDTSIQDGNVNTYFPDMIELPSTPGGPADTWCLVVPCSRAAFSENDPFFVQLSQPSWAPDDDFRESPGSGPAGFDRAMLRVFDVSDPSLIHKTNEQTPNFDSDKLPSYTLLAPPTDAAGPTFSNAYKVKTLTVQDAAGLERYFAFMADFGGRLYVYELTDLLYGSGPLTSPPHFGQVVTHTPLLTYEPLQSLSDDVRNNVHGLALDVQPYTDPISGATHDEVRLYLAVSRVGVEVLRFRVDGAGGMPSLSRETLIQTSGEMGDVWIGEDASFPGGKLLFVADYPYGLRVYGYMP